MGKITQHSKFDGVHFVLLPKIQPCNTKKRERQEDDTSAPPPKRVQAPFDPDPGWYYDRFKEAMNIRILKEIQEASGGNMETLKSNLYVQNPKGLLKSAADIAVCTQAKFKNQLDNALKSKTWQEEWRTHVDKNFQTLLERPNQQQNSSGNASQNISAEEDLEEFETCTVSLNKIIRKDLPFDMKKVILDKINNSMQTSTDYLNNFGILFHLLLLKFRSGVFIMENNSLIHRDQHGFQISSILPLNFEPSATCQIRYSSSPVPRLAPPSKKDYDSLFQKQHLELLHSYYFGVIGSQDQNLARHPYQQALFLSVGRTRGCFNDHGLSSVEMEIARTNYITAMGNMWKTNTITTNLVNRVLGVLLKIHLLNKSKPYVYNPVTKVSKNKPKSLTRNCTRNMIRQQYHLIKKYQRRKERCSPSEGRKWNMNICSCRKRIFDLQERYKLHVIEKYEKRKLECPKEAKKWDEEIRLCKKQISNLYEKYMVSKNQKMKANFY